MRKLIAAHNAANNILIHRTAERLALGMGWVRLRKLGILNPGLKVFNGLQEKSAGLKKTSARTGSKSISPTSGGIANMSTILGVSAGTTRAQQYSPPIERSPSLLGHVHEPIRLRDIDDIACDAPLNLSCNWRTPIAMRRTNRFNTEDKCHLPDILSKPELPNCDSGGRQRALNSPQSSSGVLPPGTDNVN